MASQKHYVQIVRSPAGGIRRHLLDIIPPLLKRGDKVTIVTDLKDADQKFRNALNESWFDDVEVILRTIPSRPSLMDVRNLLFLWRRFRNSKVHIFHGHGAKGGIYARLLGGRKRSVYTPHGGSLHGNYGFLMNRVYGLVEKLLLPMTGLVLAESQYTHNQFKKLVSGSFERLMINFNGIPFPEECPGKIEPQFQIGALGLLRHLKGFDLLVRATAEILPEYPDLQIHIYGIGNQRGPLLKLISLLNLTGHVHLDGANSDLDFIMNKSDIIVVPSRFESFGLVALEAMSYGVPVISSDAGGLKELVVHGETGRSFPIDSVDGLADQIRKAYENWEISKDMAKKAFTVAQGKYSLQHMQKGLVKAYQKLEDQHC